MSNKSRRKLLKSIAAGSGVIVAGKSLPESWSRPVVDSVMLPAHAQTSCTTDTITVTSLSSDNIFSRFVVIVDSSDTLVASCNDINGETATASGLAPGTYRVLGDSEGPRTHIITVATSCTSETFTETTTANQCTTLIATVSIPDGTITPGNGAVVTGSWGCGSGNLNCS